MSPQGLPKARNEMLRISIRDSKHRDHVAEVSRTSGALTARLAKGIPYCMSCISRVAFGGGNAGRSRYVQPMAYPEGLDSGKVVHGWLRLRHWRS
jgi:hypothetical protein